VEERSKRAREVQKVGEAVRGPVIRATRRGALILETENARRMMQRLKEAVEPDGSVTTSEPASAGQ
jgi:hypothetical protein